MQISSLEAHNKQLTESVDSSSEESRDLNQKDIQGMNDDDSQSGNDGASARRIEDSRWGARLRAKLLYRSPSSGAPTYSPSRSNSAFSRLQLTRR